MKPDLILAWPKNCDYPLYREFLQKERNRFDKVVIVLTAAPGMHDYSEFLKRDLSLARATVVDSPIVKADEDWRDVAIKEAMRFTASPWLLFSEQDFYVKEGFWEGVQNALETGVEVVGVFQEQRLHPCFILVKRDLLLTIKSDFAVRSGVWDHFGHIQKQLEELNVPIVKISEDLYHHFNGLSHNFRLVTEGQPPVYEGQQFIDYLKASLKAPVDIDLTYFEVAKRAIFAWESAL